MRFETELDKRKINQVVHGDAYDYKLKRLKGSRGANWI